MNQDTSSHDANAYYDDPYEAAELAARDETAVARIGSAASLWWHSRQFPGWGWTCAFVILGCFPLSLVVLGRSTPFTHHAQRYRLALEQACIEGDLERAEVLHGKLVDHQAASPDLTYRFAELLEDEGQLEEARQWMERLAPDTTSGHYAAHLWLAGQMVQGVSRLDAEASAEFAARLKYVLSEQPESLDAHALYGIVLEQAGRFDEAEAHLSRAVVVRNDVAIPLARCRARLGRVDSAIREAESAIEHYRRRVESHPGSVVDRLELARAYSFLESWQQAEEVLLKGHDQQDDPRIQRLLIETYLSAANVAARQPSQSQHVIPLLMRAYRIQPDHELVVGRLLDMTNSRSPLPNDVAEQLIAHVKRALTQSPNEVQLHSKLGQLYLIRGDHDAAIEAFQACARIQPIMHLDLAQALQMAGRDVECREAARVAANEFEELNAEHTLPPALRVLWARSLGLQEKHQESLQLLRDGLARDKSDQTLRAALATFLVEHHRRAGESPEKYGVTASQRLDLLLEAIRVDPRNAEAFRLITARFNGPAADQERIEPELRRLLAEGRAAPVVHMLLGTRAAQRGELPSARFHLERALPVHGDRPELLNNLAWVYAQQEQADHRRALELIDRALRLRPNAVELLETRGNVLMRLERWDEAIVDLELALQSLSGRPRTHLLLAEAYERIGDPATAVAHREIADRGSRN